MRKFLVILSMVVLIIGLILPACAAPAPVPTAAPTTTLPPSPVPTSTATTSPGPAPSAPTASPSPATKTITLKMISGLPKNAFSMLPAHSFVKKVNERAKGELVVNYIGGPEVISPPSQAMAVSTGVVEGAFTMAAAYAGLVPGVESLTLSKLSIAEERQRGFYEYLNREKYRPAGLYLLGKAHDGTNQNWFSIWTVKKVQTPKDLVGKRIGGTTAAINEFLKALGAAPAIVDITDLYVAIERGVVDGHWITRADTVTYGLLNLERYMIDHSVGTSSMTSYLNLKFWNQLPKNLQDIIQTAANEVSVEFATAYNDQDAKDRQAMQKAGIQFVTFSPSDVEYWYNTFYTASWADFVKRYPDFGPQIRDMLTK